MKSFKQFFFESVESEANLPPPPEKFSVPPPRAKFQLGDVVLVQNPQPSDKDYVERNMPKYLHDYTNAIGRVIGHRAIGSGSYITTEFALEFEDGKIGKAKSLLLVGPFRSIQAAKKYQGRKELTSANIAPEDHKRHAEAATEIESNEDIENTFKKLFVKEGEFAWLAEPLSFVDGKIRVMILAYKPVPNEDVVWYGGSSSISKEIQASQIFYKKVDLISNKLIKTTTFNDRGSSSYGITVPNHNESVTTFNNGTVTQLGLYYSKTAINTAKALDTIYKQTQSLKKLEEVKDGMTYFDLVNNVREQGNLRIVPERDRYRITSIPGGVTKDVNAFKNYIFEGSVNTSCVVNGQVVFPKEVRGRQFIVYTESAVENLNGFQNLNDKCEVVTIIGPVKSYAGLPQKFNCELLEIKQASSLKGFPKVINGNCWLSGIDSFEGGEGTVINGILSINEGPTSYKNIPEAEDYSGFYAAHEEEVKKIREAIRKRKFVDNQLSSDWNVDLDDFS